MPASVWSNVRVDIQSALATAVTVDGITKADPGVVTFTGADPSDGDYILFPDLSGMFQMNDRVARVANTVASTSFEVENIDTTDYSDFSSGTAQVVTFGTSLSGVTDVSASGGESRFADATTIHGQQIVEIPTVTEGFELSFEHLFDPSDPALGELRTASQAQAKRAVRITLSNGIVVFYGYVTATGIPTGGALEVVKTAITFKATGLLTDYAS